RADRTDHGAAAHAADVAAGVLQGALLSRPARPPPARTGGAAQVRLQPLPSPARHRRGAPPLHARGVRLAPHARQGRLGHAVHRWPPRTRAAAGCALSAHPPGGADLVHRARLPDAAARPLRHPALPPGGLHQRVELDRLPAAASALDRPVPALRRAVEGRLQHRASLHERTGQAVAAGVPDAALGVAVRTAPDRVRPGAAGRARPARADPVPPPPRSLPPPRACDYAELARLLREALPVTARLLAALVDESGERRALPEPDRLHALTGRFGPPARVSWPRRGQPLERGPHPDLGGCRG